ncbi:MAG: DUF2147 domain-containing protein [Paludibacteraceae bacterium]
MKKIMSVVIALWMTMNGYAQLNSILGDWKTVDDKTGDNFSIVSIYKSSDGLYYGKIAKMLVGDPDLRCEQCKDADHNKPLEGLVIIRGMQYNKEKNQLEGGKVLDPESGKFYYGKIYPKDGKLVLRGSLDRRGFLGRNQTWIRK